MVLSQGIQIGPLHFYFIRILLVAAIVRVLVRGEKPSNGMNGMDWLMLTWGGWALLASAFRADPAATLTFNLGLVFNAWGIYFLVRTFCQSREDVVWLSRVTIVLLVPIAVEMVMEQLTGRNAFSVLGGVAEEVGIRNGRLRAQGPFAHAILAGTVGAVCLPLAVGLWRTHRNTAIVGVIACTTMVVASASSGPLVSAFFALVALLMWPLRRHLRLIRWFALAGYIALDMVMKVPAYYLIGRIDVAGGSTGYHRAALIESSLKHIDEWWFAGTDYTRHWMATGVSWSPNHTDITNYYLQMGVMGGLPLMVLLIVVLSAGFSYVGRVVRSEKDISRDGRYFAWALGASLFAHAATSISVSYFDQSFVFLYLTLAAIAVTHESTRRVPHSVGKIKAAPDLRRESMRQRDPPAGGRWPGVPRSAGIDVSDHRIHDRAMLACRKVGQIRQV